MSNPHVRRFAHRVKEFPGIGMGPEHALMVEYQPILAKAKVRLLALRSEWSEVGALHQLRDELCAMHSVYMYVVLYSGVIAQTLEEANGHGSHAAVHPRARECVGEDVQIFGQWLKLNPYAGSHIPVLAVDQYWNKHCLIQSRLPEIRTQEELSELGSLYFLIEELAVEVAVARSNASHANRDFFRKSEFASSA